MSTTKKTTRYEQEYASRFKVYTRRTDGKTIVGEALAQIIASENRRNVVDIGAGDGVLTSRFRDAFDHLVVLVSKGRNISQAIRDDHAHGTALLRQSNAQACRISYGLNNYGPLPYGYVARFGDHIDAMLVPAEFDSMTVIEAKKELAERLGRFGFDSLIVGRAEDTDFKTLNCDCAYMSYAVNGINSERLSTFLNHFFNQSSQAPKLYIVTDGDYSPWGEAAKQITRYLDIPWNGGSGQDLDRMASAYCQPHLICDLETRIYAPTVEELTATLSAFFVRKRQDYDLRADDISRIIEPFTCHEDIDGEPQVVLPVSEQIYEVVPN